MLSFLRILVVIVNVVMLIFAFSHVIIARSLDDNLSPGQSPCLKLNASRLMWTGIIMMGAAVVGIVGSCCKVKALESIYLWVLIITTVANILFTGFILAVMPRQDDMQIFRNSAERGVWLKEYSPVLQRAVVNEKDYYEIKACYRDNKICEVLANQPVREKFILLENGCCKPPNRCGMIRKNITTWVANETGLLDNECKMWARVGRDCYDCDSCKAAYLAHFQEQWNRNIGWQITRIILFIFTTVLTFYAFRDDLHIHHHDGDGDVNNEHLKHGKHMQLV